MKKFLCFVLVFLMSFGCVSVFAQDMPSSWAISIVNQAIGFELVPSSLQSNYTQATTRAEFCSLAVRLYEIGKGEITERVSFSDTNDVNVEKAAAIGVVTGIGENKFAPNDLLTREQAATMLARLAEACGQPLPQQSADFADNSNISSWAVQSVGQMQASGIMSGTGNYMFSPKDMYTREQSIITIMRTFDVLAGVPVQIPPQTAPVINSLPISENLKKGMTDAEFKQAYDIAYSLVSPYAGLSQTEQVEYVFVELANIRHYSNWEYSMEEKHYSNVYGFFVLNRTSCAGDVRAAMLCLSILGVPNEHVNENQYTHQWVRTVADGEYVVLDVNAPYIGYESEPYKHPLLP